MRAFWSSVIWFQEKCEDLVISREKKENLRSLKALKCAEHFVL